MTIEQSIYNKLVATSTVTNLVGTRIYRRWLRATDARPVVTFMRVTTTQLGSSGCNHPTERITFQIDAWATTQAAARTLADHIKTGLKNWKSTDPVTGPMKLMSDRDLHESPTDGSGVGTGRISLTYSTYCTF